MASPTIESLCCLSGNNAFSKDFLSDFQSVPYNTISIVAAALGICGALYQINQWHHVIQSPNDGVSRSRSVRTRGRMIIRWLAVADLLASMGILVRSASWLADDTFGSHPDDSVLGQYFCVVTSVIIHYFYTATYMWSFVYALDVRLAMSASRSPPSPHLYHLIAWLPPLALCLSGLLILYLPDLNCHSETVNPYARFLPNYLSSFLPIVFVMIVNPILYRLSFSRVQTQIVSVRGRYTQSERSIVDSLLKKFFLINLVFYLCWLPNIINGIVLWTAWDHLPKTFIISVWYFMAILNPLQAVLNAVVYRRWDTAGPHHTSRPMSMPPPPWSLNPPLHPSAPLLDSDDDDEDPKSALSPLSRPSSQQQHRHERTERTPLLLQPSAPPKDTPRGPKQPTTRRSNKAKK